MAGVHDSLTMEDTRELNKQPSALSTGSGLLDGTNHSAGMRESVDHDSQTRKELSLKQPKFSDCILQVRQEPQFVEASEYEPGFSGKKGNSKKKSAHAIEPMPVVELVTGRERATNSSMNVNPLIFLYAYLVPEDPRNDEKELGNQLIGEHSASIFRCRKDKLTQENGYFIFQDLRVKYPGKFRISFTLCEVIEDEVTKVQYVLPCAQVHSAVFVAYRKGSPLPDPLPASVLVRQIEAGGAKLRYRKPQNKQPKKQQQWTGSLHELEEGKVVPRDRKFSKKPSALRSEGFSIEAVPMQPAFTGMQGGQGMPQPGIFSAGTYPPVTTPSISYDATHGNVNSTAMFAAQTTYPNALPNVVADQVVFDANAYANRYGLQQVQYGDCMQADSYAMGGIPVTQGMQQPHRLFPDYGMYASRQMSEQQQPQQRLMDQDRDRYQNMPQFASFNASGQPMNFGNSSYTQQYPPYATQDEQDPQQQPRYH